jgi:hypothetical protein
VKNLEDFEVEDPGKTIRVGSQLSQVIKKKLVAFFRRNNDVFAWSHEDMPKIDPTVIFHKQNVDMCHRLVK